MALADGGMKAAFLEIRSRRACCGWCLVIVNSERDPERNIDATGRVPGTGEVVDALLFVACYRATVEPRIPRRRRPALSQRPRRRRPLTQLREDAEI